MDVIYELGQAGVSVVLKRMPEPPNYSAVRAMMCILEEKGHLTHRETGKKYVYRPSRPRRTAARSAIQQVIRTFFGGSAVQAVATLLSDTETNISDKNLAQLSRLIEEGRDDSGRTE